MRKRDGILKIGQRVHIEISDSLDNISRYPSRVENISAETITLASPLRHRLPVYVQKNTEVTVWFWDSNAIYTFKTSAISSENVGIALFTVSYPAVIERIQNRDFVRVQTIVDVAVRITTRDGEELPVHCKTRDLSGGGMMLVVTESFILPKDAEIYLDFELDKESIQTMGLIIWKGWEMDSEGKERSILGVKFTTLTESNRQNIVRYVYKKEVELRRKGLL